MEPIRIINKCTSSNNPEFIYISLDTTEAVSCVGHWMWECALFLPHIKELQKDTKIPFKILLNEKKLYKTNILSDFDFHERDIVYSSNMVQDPDGTGKQQEKYVYPSGDDQNQIIYVPSFFYHWNVNIGNKNIFNRFCTFLNDFRMHYISNISDITKTIPISYIARSKVENFRPNFRNFMNADAFCKLLDDNMVNMIYTDKFQSLTPQFNDVIKSKVIIVEMGSAFTINATLIAMNSHIIVINDNWGYHTAGEPFFHIFRFLMKERNNTVEIFSRGSGTQNFSVNIDAFQKRIDELRVNSETNIL
jgi:hypothetical protein